MILAAVGLERERRIAAGPGVEAVAGGGDHQRLAVMLEAAAATARGIISIGIAGGLAPGLPTGKWVVADAVLASGTKVPTDPAWTARLRARLPEAANGSLVGVDRIVAGAADKADLHRATGALAVDMESHIVARVAARYCLPFAATRVICDPASRALPPAARVGMTDDGRVDLTAVLRSLLAQPSQLPSLILTGWDAERSFGALLRGCRRLGPGLCGPDVGQPPLDVP